MKLTEPQLATIETYLLSWELQFRDFYDEMFDHFCSEIEQRMSGGTTFDNALAETSYLFDSYEYSIGLSPKNFGLKAYETEWLVKLRNKNNRLLFGRLKEQLFNIKILFWMLLYVIVYQLSNYLDTPKLWGFLLIPSMVWFLYTYSRIFYWKGFMWKNTFSKSGLSIRVHKSKETLVSKPFTFVHQAAFFMGLINLFFNVPRLFIDDYAIPQYLGVAFAVLMMLVSYAFHKVVTQSIEEEKENSLIHQLDHSQFSNP